MLVLTRDASRSVQIGPDIRVTVLAVGKQRVKLGITAPRHIQIWRDELEPLPDDGRTAAPAADQSDPGRLGAGVLLVEDDPGHARLVRSALHDGGADDVVVVSSGEAAMDALSIPWRRGEQRNQRGLSQRPALVLLDLYLPGLSGLDVLRRIKRDPALRTMPVVMLSSASDDVEVGACLDEGANAFVVKSLDFSEFRESVARIVSFWGEHCWRPGDGRGLCA